MVAFVVSDVAQRRLRLSDFPESIQRYGNPAEGNQPYD